MKGGLQPFPMYDQSTEGGVIEDKYRDIMENGLQWTKDSRPLHYTDYDSKLVEIVIPDIPLSTKQREVIQEFLDAGKISIIIIK